MRFQDEYYGYFIKPLIASAVMGIVTYAVHLALDLLIGGRWIPTIIAILIGMIVYVVVILKIGTLSDEDIEALPMGRDCFVCAGSFISCRRSKTEVEKNNILHMAIGETDQNCIKSFKKPIMYEKGVEIMKSRYIIGFFGAFLILGMLLAAGYQLTMSM